MYENSDFAHHTKMSIRVALREESVCDTIFISLINITYACADICPFFPGPTKTNHIYDTSQRIDNKQPKKVNWSHFCVDIGGVKVAAIFNICNVKIIKNVAWHFDLNSCYTFVVSLSNWFTISFLCFLLTFSLGPPSTSSCPKIAVEMLVNNIRHVISLQFSLTLLLL